MQRLHRPGRLDEGCTKSGRSQEARVCYRLQGRLGTVDDPGMCHKWCWHNGSYAQYLDRGLYHDRYESFTSNFHFGQLVPRTSCAERSFCERAATPREATSDSLVQAAYL